MKSLVHKKGTHKGCPYGDLGRHAGSGRSLVQKGHPQGVPLRGFVGGAGGFWRLLVFEAADADGEQDGGGGEKDSYFGEDVGEGAVVPD